MESFPRAYQPISFGDVLQRLWTGRWIMMAFATVGVILASLFLHVATYSYTATLTLLPSQSQTQTSNSLGGLGGSIAALTGLNLAQGGTVSPFLIYPDALKSRVVADDLVARSPDILQHLFEGQWDESTQQWRPPSGQMYEWLTFVRSTLGMYVAPWAPPDGANLQLLISTRVRVEPNLRNPILKVSFDDRDPVFAQRFLDALHASVDRSLRQMTLDRSSEYIRYIQERLRTVEVSDVRQALVSTLSEQMRLVMMASSNTPFAAQPIGGAERSLFPTSPRGFLVLFLSLLVGSILGGLFVCRKLVYPGLATSPPRTSPVLATPREAPVRARGDVARM